MEKYHCTDANKWAKAHLDELNQAEAEKQQDVYKRQAFFSFHLKLPDGQQAAAGADHQSPLIRTHYRAGSSPRFCGNT